MATDGGKVTSGYVLLVVTAAMLATAGLLINSPVVVIGSMCVAPFLGPSRAVCIWGVFGDRKALLRGLGTQLFGLLVLGTGMAFIATVLLRATVPGIGITSEVLLRAMPTTRDTVLTVLIAVLAGAAASLALTADPRIVEKPWGQIIDTMIGVEIAISLIPPASVVGIGVAFGRLDISRDALLLLAVNVLALDIVGSMLVLGLHGVRRRWLVLEGAIRHSAQSALSAAASEVMVGESVVSVALMSPSVADIQLTVRYRVGESPPDDLAQAIATKVQDEAGCASTVTVELTPSQVYSTLPS